MLTRAEVHDRSRHRRFKSRRPTPVATDVATGARRVAMTALDADVELRRLPVWKFKEAVARHAAAVHAPTVSPYNGRTVEQAFDVPVVGKAIVQDPRFDESSGFVPLGTSPGPRYAGGTAKHETTAAIEAAYDRLRALHRWDGVYRHRSGLDFDLVATIAQPTGGDDGDVALPASYGLAWADLPPPPSDSRSSLNDVDLVAKSNAKCALFTDSHVHFDTVPVRRAAGHAARRARSSKRSRTLELDFGKPRLITAFGTQGETFGQDDVVQVPSLHVGGIDEFRERFGRRYRGPHFRCLRPGRFKHPSRLLEYEVFVREEKGGKHPWVSLGAFKNAPASDADAFEEERSALPHPVLARFVRVRPLNWTATDAFGGSSHVAFRFGAYGKPDGRHASAAEAGGELERFVFSSVPAKSRVATRDRDNYSALGGWYDYPYGDAASRSHRKRDAVRDAAD